MNLANIAPKWMQTNEGAGSMSRGDRQETCLKWKFLFPKATSNLTELG